MIDLTYVNRDIEMDGEFAILQRFQARQRYQKFDSIITPEVCNYIIEYIQGRIANAT
jgi:hypothetical protein